MHPISHFLRAPLQELRRQPLNRNFKLTAPETCLAEDVRASAFLFLALAGSWLGWKSGLSETDVSSQGVTE